MELINRECVIIGGGPAGLAAAVSVYDEGIRDILIIERDYRLGGILNQCIHNGFGLTYFKEELTGPEYAQRFIDMIHERKIDYLLDTMVLEVNKDKVVTAINDSDGLMKIQAKAVIFAMGCRERPRGALNIPGTRPAGVYSAGTAQRLVNIEGVMPGKKVVILGSGDIGLIMARRMTLEGAEVKCVLELMPYSGGLKRNIVQCLDDYDIPLKLSHTVSYIHGKDRVEGVTIAKVDEKLQPIAGTEEYIECDTLLLSVGLIPENELTRMVSDNLNPVTKGAYVDENFETDVEGFFSCGNVLHVHDLVDNVSQEAIQAGKSAAKVIRNELRKGEEVYRLEARDGVRYVIPNTISKENKAMQTLRLRVSDVFMHSYLSVYDGDERIIHRQKRIFAPGEMETVILTPKVLENLKSDVITLCIEKE